MHHVRPLTIVLVTILAVAASSAMTPSPSGGEETSGSAPVPKVITLDPETTEYMRVLGGPPETVSMRSGLVVLQPGESVGTHNTKNYEEVVIVFEGQGEMTITGGATLKLTSGTVAYCPPRTEHNVVNVGSGPLRYLYVVADTE